MKKTCSVEGCEKPACNVRGWCSTHYTRWRKYGSTENRWPKVCVAGACAEAVVARGWCQKHYQRWKAKGDVGVGREIGKRLRWLIDHQDHEGEECLLWPFAAPLNGRRSLPFRGKNSSASRIMCALAHGDPPDESMQSAHSCGKGHEGCVNPRHLRWASIKENHADRIEHGTAHRGETNPGAKLSREAVEAIRSMKGHKTQKEIAQKYGVSPSQVSLIHTGKRWKCIE